MKPFDWKRKFGASLTAIDSYDGFDRYHIENDTGEGKITACKVFSGIQAVIIDFSMDRCDNLLKPNKDVIEINYCIDGRFESTVNERYFHFVSAGDFSLGYTGRTETQGEFPTGRFRGINIFLEPETFAQNHALILLDLSIHMTQLHALASSSSRCFMLYQHPEIDSIYIALANGFTTKSIPLLKIKVLELLMFLSNLNASDTHNVLVYCNKNQAALAKSAHKLLAADLSKRTTIEELATELGIGITLLKEAFKSVYGMPIYQYQKELRLQKAQQLLRETTLPVSVIASETGYANPAKFSSAFKNRFGISPTEYKLHHRTHKE